MPARPDLTELERLLASAESEGDALVISPSLLRALLAEARKVETLTKERDLAIARDILEGAKP